MNLGYFLFQHLVTLLGIEKFLSSFSSFQCYEIVMIDGRDSNRLHLVLGAINQSTTAPSWQYLNQENTHLGGSINVQLTSSLFCLDSVTLLLLNE